MGLTVVVLAWLLFLGLACGNGGEVSGPLPTEPPPESRETITLEVTVGPEIVDCQAVGPWKCLVVDGEYFYDTIEGFEYEPGYTYRIRMERYDRWPDRDEPPQDAGRYGYRLIEVLDKVREP